MDTTQGAEAQTVSNLFLALEHDLTIIPVLNKIDMPAAEVDAVQRQVIDLMGGTPDDMLLVSAKQGIGIEEVLETIVTRIPPPSGTPDASLRALIFDSLYDHYRGVICFVRVVDGTLRKGLKVRFYAAGREYEVEEVGILRLQRVETTTLSAGEVGYLIAGVRVLADARVGDTVVEAQRVQHVTPLPGYRPLKPMVFSGLHPVDSEDYTACAMHSNDSA